MNTQIGICDPVSNWSAIPVPIVQHVSFYLISVTKLWDMMIRQCMCKGRIGHSNVLHCQSHQVTTNECDVVLPVVVELDYYIFITHKTH